MKKILTIGVASSLLVVVFTVVAVFAAAYSAPYTITETNSNAYTMLGVSVSVGNQWLADNGFMEADALDTRIETLSGLEQPHMVADDRTLTAVVVPADSQTNLYFTTGNTDLTAMDIITGYDGYITVADDAALELGDGFEVEIKGYIDTTAGSNKNLVFKNAAFKIYISAEGSIKAEITGGTSVTATGVASGEHTVLVKTDGIDLEIYVDDMGTPKDTSALGGVGVPDNSNDWKLLDNNVMPYVEYVKFKVG